MQSDKKVMSGRELLLHLKNKVNEKKSDDVNKDNKTIDANPSLKTTSIEEDKKAEISEFDISSISSDIPNFSENDEDVKIIHQLTSYIPKNMRPKKEFTKFYNQTIIQLSKYPFYKNPEFFNINYKYELFQNPYSGTYLYSCWNNIKSIFPTLRNKKNLNLSISDVKRVKYIYIKDFSIVINFDVEGFEDGLETSVDKLFDDTLFIMYRNYLFFDLGFESYGFADTTLTFELYKWITLMKNYVGDDYDLSELNVLGIKDRKKETNSELKLIELDINKPSYSKILRTNDKQIAIQIKDGKRKFHYALKDYKNMIAKNEYDNLKNKIDANPMEIEDVNQNLDTLINLNELSKPSKERKKKFIKKNYYDNMINNDNCFLFALSSLCDIFKIKINVSKFKQLDLKNQIQLANNDLMTIKKKLILREEAYEILGEYVKRTQNKSLLVFYHRDGIIHCEAIENFSFINEVQHHIKKLENEYVNIKNFEMADFNIDDDEKKVRIEDN